jgi:hypothetical protein
MYGQLARNLDENPEDNEPSYGWTQFGEIKHETQSTTAAAHDQAFSTNYSKNKILKEGQESRCRLCEHEDTTDRLTSGCPILAKNVYLIRHDRACAHFHYMIWAKH